MPAGGAAGDAPAEQPAGVLWVSYFFWRRLFRFLECEAAATLAMLSPWSRETSVGMLFTKSTHCEKSLEAEEPAIRPLNFSYNRVKGNTDGTCGVLREDTGCTK
jgi:hypothetical protein